MAPRDGTPRYESTWSTGDTFSVRPLTPYAVTREVSRRRSPDRTVKGVRTGLLTVVLEDRPQPRTVGKGRCVFLTTVVHRVHGGPPLRRSVKHRHRPTVDERAVVPRRTNTVMQWLCRVQWSDPESCGDTLTEVPDTRQRLSP